MGNGVEGVADGDVALDGDGQGGVDRTGQSYLSRGVKENVASYNLVWPKKKAADPSTFIARQI